MIDSDPKEALCPFGKPFSISSFVLPGQTSTTQEIIPR